VGSATPFDFNDPAVQAIINDMAQKLTDMNNNFAVWAEGQRTRERDAQRHVDELAAQLAIAEKALADGRGSTGPSLPSHSRKGRTARASDAVVAESDMDLAMDTAELFEDDNDSDSDAVPAPAPTRKSFAAYKAKAKAKTGVKQYKLDNLDMPDDVRAFKVAFITHLLLLSNSLVHPQLGRLGQ